LEAFEVQYTDKEYTSQVGTISIAPLEALNTAQLNAVPLAQGQSYELIFDLLNPDYQYLKMKIFHCDWNWIPSKLNDLEFLSKYNEFTIADYEFSQSNFSAYVTYKTVIPKLKISGNYIICIYKDDKSAIPLFTRKFIVYENLTYIDANISTSKQPKNSQTHQKINLKINYGTLEISNSQDDFKVVLIQNRDWKHALMPLLPTQLIPNEKTLIFNYLNDEMLFPGLNTFRFFDARSISYRGQNVMALQPTSRGIDLILKPESPKKGSAFSQTLNTDLNGAYYTQTLDPNARNFNSEYVWVHFRMNINQINGDIFIHGGFNNWQLNLQNKMIYDENMQAYTGSIRVKQGFYNYNYYVSSEQYPFYWIDGSHYEHRNKYEILVYYRAPGSLNDRLVGYKKL
tara:strand:- start:1056 stop:2252 length:1197 start_codon:yes stop_codon:yes gene_type:complete